MGELKISLDRQIHILSVDTSLFYNEKEQKIHEDLKILYSSKKDYNKKYKKMINNKENFTKEEILELKKSIKNLNKQISDKKNKELKIKISENSKKRVLNDSLLKNRNVISIFESVLTRILGLKTDEKTENLIVVQTYFYKIFEDIVKNGFIFKGEDYVLLTASAGQIRTKKSVFIKKDLFDKHYLTFSCGLTLDKINKKGMNINKYLAYLALNNSATDIWDNFDINRTIVVDDLETEINTEVDYIYRETFNSERKFMNVPVNHTDGCGIMLPSVNEKAFMMRAPWMKGLLVPFDFLNFIKEKNGTSKIKDIYGDEWDIVNDDIQIIFTKSQFKMHAYYKNWKEYKKYFKKYRCQAALCNEEPDDFPNATLTYQMLQTLNKMSEKDLRKIADKTVKDINNIGRDKEATFKLFGITKENYGKTSLQKSIEIYNPLIKEYFVKQTIKSAKKSMIKKAKSGKIEIDGRYTYIVPDLYGFCEYLFLNEKNPKGLLMETNVYCNLFNNQEELDILRSPHLYREHGLRINNKNNETKKWLLSNCMYISLHDTLSKLLMYDSDGDRVLVTNDKTMIKNAKKHMENIVPLYYEMEVATKEKINNDNLYTGMELAYKGGKIGEISNNISKVWNSENVDEQAIEVVKWLCLLTNFEIDYAKTLFTLTPPKDKTEIIKKYTGQKLPYFFKFAKDKLTKQVNFNNQSTVNKLNKIIPQNRIYFDHMGIGDFDYKVLMRNKNIIVNQELIKLFIKLESKENVQKLRAEQLKDNKNYNYVYSQIRNKILETQINLNDIVDMLVLYFHETKPNSNKETLWKCFGSTILRNIRRNSGLCEECGVVIENRKQKQFYCESCAKRIKNEKIKKIMREKRKK